MEKKIYFGAVLTLALILSMMSFSSAIQSNWTDSFTGLNFGVFGAEGGMLILPTQPIVIDNITVGADTTFNTLYIRNAPHYSGSNIANSTNKSGNIFYFNHVLIDVDYTWIIGSADGNHEYAGQGNPIVPKLDNGIRWEDGLNPTNGQTGQASLVGGFDILKIDYHLPLISIINLTSEMLNPIDNMSVTVPVTLTAELFVSGSQLTNATLYIWNASDNSLALTDLKTESIVNSTTAETWVVTLPINKAYEWNVQVCEIGGVCAFDEENETFYTIATPIVNNPNHLIRGQGDIFNAMDSIGAGFAIFLQVLGVALPFLLIGLGIVGVVVAIGFGIVHIIKISLNK